MGLVWSIATGLWKGGMVTQRGKVHEAGKGDSPEACGVDDPTTVDLVESWSPRVDHALPLMIIELTL